MAPTPWEATTFAGAKSPSPPAADASFMSSGARSPTPPPFRNTAAVFAGGRSPTVPPIGRFLGGPSAAGAQPVQIAPVEGTVTPRSPQLEGPESSRQPLTPIAP